MADSCKVNADYARPGEASATSTEAAKVVSSGRRFRPRLWPTLAAALLVPLFLAAGQWQWNKASLKSARQLELDTHAAHAPIAIPTTRIDAESLLYRKIVAQGYYEPQHQILIDNLTYHQQAGYHVITPLRIDGSEIRLLVNRGWVPGLADHRQIPQIDTPNGRVEISGTAIVPSTRFYTLEKDSSNAPLAGQSVWQNLDLQRYGQAVSFPIQPIVIQLDPESTAGGFVREWRRPDDRLQTNLNYAIQWWSFAATTVVLWLVLNFRKPS
jgi:surfeit locus 1 family protein